MTSCLVPSIYAQFLICLLLLGSLSGCATSSGPAKNGDPSLPANDAIVALGALSPPEVESARSLCVAKCSKCHKFYPPQDYNETEWNEWMGKMIKKSKLSRTEADLVTAYTQGIRTLKNK